MACIEYLNGLSQSRNIKILATLLLLLVVATGVAFLMSERDHETVEEESRLKLIPDTWNGSHQLVLFNSSNPNSYGAIVNRISHSLEVYNFEKEKTFKCDSNNRGPPGTVCEVDFKDFGICTKANGFGYSKIDKKMVSGLFGNKTKPCVFLQLSREDDWVPQIFLKSDLSADLPSRISSMISKDEQGFLSLGKVWVDCDGKDAIDRENVGPINYFPHRWFSSFFFGCAKEETQCPDAIIAINFEEPKTGVLINIQCRALARNLNETIEFQLWVD